MRRSSCHRGHSTTRPDEARRIHERREERPRMALLRPGPGGSPRGEDRYMERMAGPWTGKQETVESPPVGQSRLPGAYSVSRTWRGGRDKEEARREEVAHQRGKGG